jgi:hypothetical protein
MGQWGWKVWTKVFIEEEEINQTRIRRKAKVQVLGIWWGGKAVGEGGEAIQNFLLRV